ncbi:hypothetical protein L484_012621 [Morus notabilis]|uniref:Uncharacterized protein n=1 Tax=Morus notabilis TaxID=981085 RepID=W9S9L8_9ROSA|nr:uncharacterized protein LOC21395821 [Morus notabilis]XP_010112035.1 uncharacterized protein LOC21395822 [Morus notabilis]EXC32453.1 hypothetical protein L484_012620 [Morus notabilis]EXC32454.1 hypothetical protein L484_012621 [Morus notabilis]
MKATMASISIPSSSSTQTSKRLLFDRRYGWVIDEWKPPSEEALTGGRGMFCILPLARALLKMASQSINLAASSAVKALEKPDLFSPHVLQAGFKGQLHKIKSSLTNSDINSLSQGKSSVT